MTVLRRYLESRASLEGTYPLTSQALIDLFTTQVSSGVVVSETRALGVPAVYRAVSLISGVAAALPLKTYRNNLAAGTRDEVRTPLLEEPYPGLTPFLFWERAYVDLLLWGNSYHYKSKDGLGNVVRLLRIPPWQVTPVQEESTGRNPSGVTYRIDNTQDRYAGGRDGEIMHIPGLGYDGLAGLSRIGLAKEAVGLAMAAEETAAKLFGDGFLFAGVLTSDQSLNPTQAQGFAEAFKAAMRAGFKGPGMKVPVFGRGTKFEKISMAPEEGQFLESRQHQVHELGRMFGIDPALMMDPAAALNYGEPQRQAFLTFTMDQWLVRVEQAAGLHLTPRGQFCEYVRGGFLRADTATRFQTYAQAVQFGILTRNEARALENLPPLDGLDEPLTPANLGGAPNEQPVPGESPAPGQVIGQEVPV